MFKDEYNQTYGQAVKLLGQADKVREYGLLLVAMAEAIHNLFGDLLTLQENLQKKHDEEHRVAREELAKR